MCLPIEQVPVLRKDTGCRKKNSIYCRMATKNEDGFDKLTNRDEKWMANYEALKAHVFETGHFPNCFAEFRNLDI